MSDLDEGLLQELLKTFRVEAGEHLELLNQSLLKLERAPEAKVVEQLVQDAFRAAHSLKGASRAVGLDEIEQLAHAMESILQLARDTGMQLDANTCDILYRTVDTIGELVSGDEVDALPVQDALEAIVQAARDNPREMPKEAAPVTPKTAPIPPTPPEPPIPPTPPVQNVEATPTEPAAAQRNPAHPIQDDFGRIQDETIRVSVTKLDDLMAQVGELLVSKISADQRQLEAERLSFRTNQWTRTWREVRALLPHMDGDTGTKLQEVLSRHAEYMHELSQDFNEFNQSINRDTVRLGMVTADLQDRVRHVRMVPFQVLVLTLERAVRDTARSEGKQVDFEISGQDVELDKQILESLKDPLMHLLRNAVGHGIEDTATRLRAEKPEIGNISLKVEQRGSEVHIHVSDDGRGFNLAALRTSGSKHNSEIELMTSDEIIGLAFLPGISTAESVTAISGRGVGLDVVRQSLESVQGRIAVDNHPGSGVTISLVVPTSLAMTRGLMVRVGREQYVLPLLSIEKILAPDDVIMVGGKEMLMVDEQPLPMIALASVLERPMPDERQARNPLAIIMAVAGQRIAFLVDNVLTEQEMAVKTMGSPLKRIRNVTGAALLGNGEPVVVLNPADLMKSASRSQRSSFLVSSTSNEVEDEQRHILVVDDSITTRTLEKNILEAAGFRVTTATHGLEALQRLEQHASVDVVVSDVQMPNMDGVELTAHLRDHNEYGSLPVILVTSLESREDRERGMLAGADAYIVKRGFDQAELLATIQRLL